MKLYSISKLQFQFDEKEQIWVCDTPFGEFVIVKPIEKDNAKVFIIFLWRGHSIKKTSITKTFGVALETCQDMFEEIIEEYLIEHKTKETA